MNSICEQSIKDELEGSGFAWVRNCIASAQRQEIAEQLDAALSRADCQQRRRIIHLELAECPILPDGLRWYQYLTPEKHP